MADVDNILIVGGGIAGLTLAAALAQRGFRAELVERNPDWQALGAGLAVQANGMRILGRLGMDAAAREAGAVLRRWIFADEQGDVLSETDIASLWSAVGPSIGIARASLQKVLVQGASSIPCRLNTSITSLVEDDRRVSVTFTDGSTGDYDVVVGADGIHSTVRDHAIGTTVPTFAQQIVWRSLAPVRLPGPPSVQFWLGEGSFFGLCSVGDGYTYGFGNVSQERQYDPVEGRLERLRDRFAGYGAGVRDYLARLDSDDQIHCSPIEWVEQEHWHTGRVVLIGDAAHATSPMMGQGGSLAMEDAWVLTEALRAAPTIERALSAFAHRRRPRVDWVQQASRAVADSFRLPSQPRNAALRERGDMLLHQRFSPLVEDP